MDLYIYPLLHKLRIRRIGCDGKLQCEAEYDAMMPCNSQENWIDREIDATCFAGTMMILLTGGLMFVW
jgi:hypothetical protein